MDKERSSVLKKNKEAGFVILFTVLIVSVILSISLGVFNITIKELNISSSSRDSRFAFFASDTGVECATYWDIKGDKFSTSTSGDINCAGVTINDMGGSGVYVNRFLLNLSNGSCTDVTVDKTDGAFTVITSRGYNTCVLTNPRRVERALRVRYNNVYFPVQGGGSTLNEGLVEYWTLNDGVGSVASDSSGNGNDGTLTNMDPATDWVLGQVGIALDFDGVDDYVIKSNPSGIPNTNQPMTISLFVNPSSRSGIQNFVVINDIVGVGGEATNAVQLGFDTTETFLAWKAGGATLVDSNFTPSVNTWYHLVYTYDGTTSTIYVDGVSKNTSTVALQPGSVASVWLGTYNGASELFQGIIDDVRIYNRVLTQSEITALYNLGN